jgi:integrase
MKECAEFLKGGAEGLTWKQFWPQYVDKFCRVRLKPKTIELRGYVATELLRFFGDLPLSKTTDRLIDDFIAGLKSKGLKNRTINIHLTILAQALKVALRWEWIAALPYREIEQLSEGPSRVRYLSDDERERLLSAAGPYFSKVFLFYVFTGLRRNELRDLKHSEVDVFSKRIMIAESKTGQIRWVPLCEPALEIYRSIPRRLGVEFVFWNPKNGKRWADLTHIFMRRARAAGVTNIRLHDLRHTFASYMVQNDVALNTVRELLGHKSVRMTLRYAHLSSDVMQNAVDKLGVFVEKSAEKNIILNSA